MIFQTVIELTPALMASLLEHQHKNRSVSNVKVDTWESLMRRNMWVPEHPEGFVVYWEGANGFSIADIVKAILAGDAKMIDGQHRALAVVRVGRAIVVKLSIVTTWKEAEPIIWSLNSGKPRGDKQQVAVLDLLGKPVNRKWNAAVCALELLGTVSPSKDDILAFAKKMEPDFDACSFPKKRLERAEVEAAYVLAYDIFGESVRSTRQRVHANIGLTANENILSKATFDKVAPKKSAEKQENTERQSRMLKVIRLIETCLSGNKTLRLKDAQDREAYLAKLKARKAKRNAFEVKQSF